VWLGGPIPDNSSIDMIDNTLGTDGYRYDADTDRVVPIDTGGTLAGVDRHWDQSDEGFTGHADIVNDGDEGSYQGFAIDIGDFFVDQTLRNHILWDDTASVMTLGIPRNRADSSPSASDAHSNSAAEYTSDAVDVEDANITIGSSLTESTQNLTIDVSLATLLANESLDPTIPQAIMISQQAAKSAGEQS
jgi:hypothetical protein